MWPITLLSFTVVATFLPVMIILLRSMTCQSPKDAKIILGT